MDIQQLVATASGQSPNATAKLPASSPGAFARDLAQAARQASGSEADVPSSIAGKAAASMSDDAARLPQRGDLGAMKQALGEVQDDSGASSETGSARLAAIVQRLALIEGVGRPGEGTAKAGAALTAVTGLDPLAAESLAALAEAAKAGDTPDTVSLNELADLKAALADLRRDASGEHAEAAIEAGAPGWMARVEALAAVREAGQGQKAERGVAMSGAAIDRPLPDAEPLRADRAALDALRHATQQRNTAEPPVAVLATRTDDIARAIAPDGDLRAGPAGERWVGSGIGSGGELRGERGESFAAALNAQSAGAAAGQPAASATLTAPVNSPAWPQQLGQQLVMLGQRGGEQRVEMHLHPAELGPLSISLKVSDQSAQLQFLSANAQVRGAVEQAIPQLREALAEQGISLGDTSVGEQRQGPNQEFAGSMGRQSSGGVDSGEAIADAPASGSPAAADITLDGRVDLYA